MRTAIHCGTFCNNFPFSNDRFEVASLILHSCQLPFFWGDNCYNDESRQIDLNCNGLAQFERTRDVEIEYACVPEP